MRPRTGCGKTTLLGILAGSVASLSASSRVSGRILLDGHERRSWASRLVAYVPQNDFLLPTLTVAETLRYSAQLRLPRGTSAVEVQVRRGHAPTLRGQATGQAKLVASLLLLCVCCRDAAARCSVALGRRHMLPRMCRHPQM